MFEEVGGTDALLFQLFVLEYDKNCSSPKNKGVAYISYLDSIPFSSVPRCVTSSENRIASTLACAVYAHTVALLGTGK